MMNLLHMRAALDLLREMDEWNRQTTPSIRGDKQMVLNLKALTRLLIKDCVDTAGGRKFSMVCVSYITVALKWSFISREVPTWNKLTNKVRREIENPVELESHLNWLGNMLRQPSLTDADLIQFKMMI